MSQVEYLQSVYHQNRGTEERRNAQRLFFRRHGMDEDLTEKLLGRGQDYLKRVSILPPAYHRISHGEEITIGPGDVQFENIFEQAGLAEVPVPESIVAMDEEVFENPTTEEPQLPSIPKEFLP